MKGCAKTIVRIALISLLLAFTAAACSGCFLTVGPKTKAVAAELVTFDDCTILAPTLAEQVTEQSKGGKLTDKRASYDIDVEIADLSHVRMSDLNFKLPKYDYNAPDAEWFKADVENKLLKALREYVCGDEIEDTQTVTVEANLKKADGKWSAELGEDSVDELTEVLRKDVNEFIERAEVPEIACMELAEHKDELLSGLLVGGAYLDAIQFKDITNNGDGTFAVTLQYPEPSAVYPSIVETQVAAQNELIFNEEFSVIPAANASDLAAVSPEQLGEYSFTAEYDGGAPRAAGLEELEKEFTSSYSDAESEIRRRIMDKWYVAPVEPPKSSVLSGESKGNKMIMKTYREDLHYYIRYYKLNDAGGYDISAPYLTAFIVGGEKLTVKLPVGDYKLVQASGTSWYGEKYMFGPEGQYSEWDEPLDSTNGYYWTLKFDVEDGNAGSTDLPYTVQ